MISIIIPVFNEEKAIVNTLESLPLQNKNVEVIVSDGGSTDSTLDIVKKFPVKIVRVQRNRAIQMNEVADIAEGDIFLFLHGDCILEKNSISRITNYLNKHPKIVGGCLQHKIDCCKIIYRWIELTGNIRAKLFKIFYGDQGIFVRKKVFDEIGGFDEVDLFEDVIFSKKLKRLGKTVVLDKKVYTSVRRWQSQGIVKTTIINWVLTLGFGLNIHPNTLNKIYQDVR